MVPKAVSAFAWVSLLGLSLLGAAGCRALEPSGVPESTCTQSCRARTQERCTETQCSRGCRLALDRLVEREGDRVIACAAKSTAPCDDFLWADCAARIGPMADGGPPAPAKPEEEE